jgi:hypothetical protein
LRDWRQRGIDHEGVQSVKTAERLGLLIQEVQAFFMMQRRWVFDDVYHTLRLPRSRIVIYSRQQ